MVLVAGQWNGWLRGRSASPRTAAWFPHNGRKVKNWAPTEGVSNSETGEGKRAAVCATCLPLPTLGSREAVFHPTVKRVTEEWSPTVKRVTVSDECITAHSATLRVSAVSPCCACCRVPWLGSPWTDGGIPRVVQGAYIHQGTYPAWYQGGIPSRVYTPREGYLAGYTHPGKLVH